MHKIVNVIFVVVLFTTASNVSFAFQSQQHSATGRGLTFLFEKQNDDGSWKSEYYGNLKQGAAITSLVLFTVSHSDQKTIEKHKAEIRSAFEFQRKGIKKNGYVSNVSGPDYAVYATSLLILANKNLAKMSKTQWLNDKEIQLLQKFLCNAQLDETHGLKPGDSDYGGWDLSGWMQSQRTSPGSNVSVSSFAIEALADDSSADANRVRQKFLRWTERIQNKDGGFHFHPKKSHEGNKAGWSDQEFNAPKSYGTATADGIRILKSLIRSPSKQSTKRKAELNARLESAKKWIEQQAFRLSVPGFDESDDPSWSNGLFYYYSMSILLELDSFSAAFQKSSEDIARFLVKEQKPDGSWSNSSTRMREDDPMIATCFAIVALSQCKQK